MLLALLLALADHSAFERTGFYPLWENTGTVLDRREALLGTDYLELGLGRDAQARGVLRLRRID